MADARRRVYKRARSAVLAEMNRAHPPVDQSDILAAQMYLEAAIKEGRRVSSSIPWN
jgi:hypothetical protein